MEHTERDRIGMLFLLTTIEQETEQQKQKTKMPNLPNYFQKPYRHEQT